MRYYSMWKESEAHFSFIILPMYLSVIIPVFNEKKTLNEVVTRVLRTRLADEIILVDDCSTDGTRDLLTAMEATPAIRLITHDRNQGKGAAIRTGIAAARGEVILIQDADLEYDPCDYPALLKPIQEGRAQVVYGSRFMAGPRRVMNFWFMLGNKILTHVTNLLFGTHPQRHGNRVQGF